MNEQLYCGIDLHKSFSSVCIMNQGGKVLERRKVHHNGNEFKGYFERKRVMECVLEPIDKWGWAVDCLQGIGHRVHLANPWKVRLIAESRVKTDKIDASVLANLLRAGYLPEGYIAPMEVRDRRTYLRYRIQLGRQRARLKNHVRRVLRVENVSEPGYSDLFGVRGRGWLSEVSLRPIHGRIKDETLETIDRYDELIKKLDKEITSSAKADEAVKHLMTIPGIGKLTAQVIMAEAGDMRRFPTAKHFAGYVGLGVSERSSGGKVYRGHITKEGNKHIRWLLVEGAQKAKSIDGNLKRFFDRIAYKKGKAKATVAVARKLAEVCWHVVIDRQDYDTNKVQRRVG